MASCGARQRESDVGTPVETPAAVVDPGRNPPWPLAAIGLIALYSYFFWHACVEIGRDKLADFNHFYYAAEAMRCGSDIYSSWHHGYLYPPMWAFLLVPLSRLEIHDAARVQAAINSLVGLGAILLLAHEVGRRFWGARDARRTLVLAFIVCLVLNGPLRADLKMGQTNSFVLAGVVLGLWALDRFPVLAGMALGFAFNIKFQLAAFPPYLLVRRRWAAAAWSIAGICLWSLVPALWTGWRENLHNLGVAYSGVLDLVGIDTGEGVKAMNPLDASFSISLTSAFARAVGRGHEVMALGLTGLVAAISLGLAWMIYRRARTPFLAWPPSRDQAGSPWAGYTAVEWAGLVVVALAFSPQTNSRHLVLLAVPVACAAAMVFSGGPARRLAIASLVVMFIGVSFPPGMSATRGAEQWWRDVGGVSWCALGAYALLLLAAHARAGVRVAGPAAGDVAIASPGVAARSSGA